MHDAMAIKINFQLDIPIGTFNLNDTGQHSDCTENLLLFLYAYATTSQLCSTSGHAHWGASTKTGMLHSTAETSRSQLRSLRAHWQAKPIQSLDDDHGLQINDSVHPIPKGPWLASQSTLQHMVLHGMTVGLIPKQVMQGFAVM